MKILFLLPKFANTGPANVVAALISSPQYQDHEIFLCSFFGAEPNYLHQLTHHKLSHIQLKGVGIKGLNQLRKLLKQHDITILHSHCLIPDIASCLLTPFVKCAQISTVHCDLKTYYAMEYSGIKSLLYYYLHTLAVRFISQRISVSQSVQRSLPCSSDVIRNGVKAKINSRQPSQSLSLIFAGRLVTLKNVQFVIDCVNHLTRQQWPNIQLHIYGDGEHYQTINAQQNEHIHVHGFTHDFIAQTPNNSLFVNPSLSEGLPMSVIEAIAAGIPCLLSNIEPHQEIAQCVKSGIALFDFNLSAFEQALRALTTNHQQVHVNQQQLLADFEQNLSDQHMAKQYIAHYHTRLKA